MFGEFAVVTMAKMAAAPLLEDGRHVHWVIREPLIAGALVTAKSHLIRARGEDTGEGGDVDSVSESVVTTPGLCICIAQHLAMAAMAKLAFGSGGGVDKADEHKEGGGESDVDGGTSGLGRVKRAVVAHKFKVDLRYIPCTHFVFRACLRILLMAWCRPTHVDVFGNLTN
jgi:hypothetical protein